MDSTSETSMESSAVAKIRYIRVQVDGHTVIEFMNNSRACSCGLERGETPSLKRLK